jgi:hypothetical protein
MSGRLDVGNHIVKRHPIRRPIDHDLESHKAARPPVYLTTANANTRDAECDWRRQQTNAGPSATIREVATCRDLSQDLQQYPGYSFTAKGSDWLVKVHTSCRGVKQVLTRTPFLFRDEGAVDAPQPLSVVASIAFPNGSLTASGLRRESAWWRLSEESGCVRQ